MLWLEIFLLALANTLIFSWFDYENDMKEAHLSLAQIIGSGKIQIISFLVLSLLGIIIIISLYINTLWVDQLIILIMGLVLFVILIIGKQNKRGDGLRIAGEAIFLIPLLRLIF